VNASLDRIQRGLHRIGKYQAETFQIVGDGLAQSIAG